MVRFQILDWKPYHELDDDNKETFMIRIFGRIKKTEDTIKEKKKEKKD